MTRIIKSVFRGKTRTILTMSGIGIGVFAVVLISAVGSAGTRQIGSALDGMGINTVLVQPVAANMPTGLTKEDLSGITKLGGIKSATALMAANTELVMRGNSEPCLAWGVDNNAKDIINLKAKYGRLISSADNAAAKRVCVVDEDMAIATYGRANVVGKTARILVGGHYNDYEVVGVAMSGISTLQSVLGGLIPGFVYIPFTTMQLDTGRVTYDKIAVQLFADSDAVCDAIVAAIEQRRGGYAGITASNILAQKGQLESILGTVTFVLSLIAGISLLVSGLTVMTTMLASVGERTREIGIKKSIGATNSDILREFLTESIVLSGLGSAAGALSAAVTAAIGFRIAGLSFRPDLFSIITPIIIAVIMGCAFGAYPAVKAAKLDPIVALRN